MSEKTKVWELLNHFYYYEDPYIPDFQLLLTQKAEFSELKSTFDERLPEDEPPVYFKHQKFYHRFLRSYDNLLILDETGTGKTCSVIGYIEKVLKEKRKKLEYEEYDQALVKFKKIYILTRGKNQIEDLRHQIVCKCSGEKYQNKMLKEKAQRKHIKWQLKQEGYEITTYNKFVSSLLRNFPKSKENRLALLEQEFSDCIFWIDEGHNLILDTYLVQSSSHQETFQPLGLEKKTIYEELHLLFHLIKRSKIIISTATPMINNVNDFRYLINLLLPLNNFIPRDWDLSLVDKDLRFRKAFFPSLPLNQSLVNRNYEELDQYFRGQIPESLEMEKVALEDIEPYLRGKIGYVRAGKTNILIKEMGERITSYVDPETGETRKSYLTLYISRMSKFQEEAFFRSREKEKRSKEFFVKSRQASNFVFPDGNWGSGKKFVKKQEKKFIEEFAKETEEVPSTGLTAYKKYVIKDSKGNFEATKEFKSNLANPDRLKELSCKFYEIISLCKKAYGNCFVYSDFVEGSGSEVLSLAFEEQGFLRFDQKISVFVDSENIVELKSYCSTGKEKSKERRLISSFIPHSEGGQYRYALLTKDTTELEFDIIMETMNCYENRHGDLIKVLISSRVGRDGLNVNNVTQIHLVGPEWNQSAIYQAISRGIRTLSHEDLILEMKEKSPKKLLEVEIYKHCAVPNNGNLAESTDFHMYTVAEKKDISIRKLMRFIKQCSIGCEINKQRNIRIDDEDYTPSCDYQECNYSCYDFQGQEEEPEETYYNYNALYAKEYIEELKYKISKIFSREFTLTFQELIKILREENSEKQYFASDIFRALYEIIDKKISILDRFGNTKYLIEDNGYFTLVENQDLRDPLLLSYYSRRLISISSFSLRELVDIRNNSINRENYEKLKEKIKKNQEFIPFLESLTAKEQSYIIEESIIDKVKNKDSLVFDNIKDHYKNILFNLPEQQVKKKDKSEIQDVFIHLLLTQTMTDSKYGLISKYNKAQENVRILKLSELEKGWYTLGHKEALLYSSYIAKTIERNKEDFEKHEIYGIMLQDGKFRIRDKTTQAAKSVSDKRFINKGRICTSWDKNGLIDLCWKLKIFEPSGKFLESKKKDRKTLEEELRQKMNKEVEKLSDEELAFYHSWAFSTVKRTLICDLIKKTLEERNLVFK
jgi:hypothetical protein